MGLRRQNEAGQAAVEIALAIPTLILVALFSLEAANVVLTHFAADSAAEAAARSLVAQTPLAPGEDARQVAAEAASLAASWHGEVGEDDVAIERPDDATETTYTHHLWYGADVADALASEEDVAVSVTVHRGWATFIGPLWHALASAAGRDEGISADGMQCTAKKVVVIDLTAAKSVDGDGMGVTDWDKYVG